MGRLATSVTLLTIEVDLASTLAFKKLLIPDFTKVNSCQNLWRWGMGSGIKDTHTHSHMHIYPCTCTNARIGYFIGKPGLSILFLDPPIRCMASFSLLLPKYGPPKAVHLLEELFLVLQGRWKDGRNGDIEGYRVLF